MNKTCRNCTSRRIEDSFCQLFNIQVEESTKACPLHSTTVCAKCGRPIQREKVLSNKGIYCLNCTLLLGTCTGCQHSTSCAFQEDPTPIPKTVVKTFQQGPMTLQQEIANPDRILETCAKNCKCYNEEFGCMRQYESCKEYLEL